MAFTANLPAFRLAQWANIRYDSTRLRVRLPLVFSTVFLTFYNLVFIVNL